MNVNVREISNLGAIYSGRIGKFDVMFSDGQTRRVLANNTEHARMLGVLLRKSEFDDVYYKVVDVQAVTK